VNGLDGMTAMGQPGAPQQLDPQITELLRSLNLTPEDLQAMMEAGVFGERNALAKEQTSMADALRGTAMPEGRQMGPIYVAPSILENAAAAAKQMVGQRDTLRMMDERRQMIDLLRKGRQSGGVAAMMDRFGNPKDPRAYDYEGTGY